MRSRTDAHDGPDARRATRARRGVRSGTLRSASEGNEADERHAKSNGRARRPGCEARDASATRRTIWYVEERERAQRSRRAACEVERTRTTARMRGARRERDEAYDLVR